MDREKTNIILHAQQKFFKEGFYKITLDELAKELHISKKTIYKHFASKEELVREATFHFLNESGNKIANIVHTETSALEKFVLLIETFVSVLSRFNNRWLSDVQFFAKDLWNEIDEFRTQKLSANLSKMIEQGIEEGIFKERPIPIVLQIFISSIRGVVNPEFIMNSNFAVQTAMKETVTILIESMLTPKGEKIFKKMKNGVKK